MPELSLSMECHKTADGAANSPKSSERSAKSKESTDTRRAFPSAILGVLFALDFGPGLE
jgi:hypothetical protein